MKRRERHAPFTAVLIALLLALAPASLHAALLVADGGTTNRTTGINLSPADLVVGTNAGNTTVNIIAPGAVTNASGYIGFNTSSSTNKVTVQNSGAVWNNSGWLYVGNSGARNSLIVSNAGRAFSSGGVIGSDFGSSNNQAVVTGSGSSWKMDFGELDIGGAGSGNALLIANGGAVTNGLGSIGYQFGANSNQVTVTDGGSVWKLDAELSVGEVGAGNSLLVTNGGLVSGTTAYLGRYSDGNRATVTGPNSAINLSGGLWPGGVTGAGNTLIIANGGRVANGYGWIGSGGSGNQVTVTGSASSWTNAAEVVVGGNGSGNQLTVETNGTVSCGTDAIIGQSSGAGNLLKLTGGTLAVGGALDVRRGSLQLDSGTATATTLWATNGASSSILFNGGTLITRGGTISNGQAFTIGHNPGYPDAVWVVLSNALPTTVAGQLFLSSNAPNAKLIITNGATLSSGAAQIGFQADTHNSRVVISGPNSRWNVNGTLTVGVNGMSRLFITNGGSLFTSGCTLGYNVPVQFYLSGQNALWTNNGTLNVGQFASSIFLSIGTGGSLGNSGSIYVGAQSGGGNTLAINGGTLFGAGLLDVRWGALELNSGTATVGTLLATNAIFDPEVQEDLNTLLFNGGTLSVSNSTVDNAFPVFVGNSISAAVFELRGNGLHTFQNGLALAANATLRGSGTIFCPGGTLTKSANSTLSPGLTTGAIGKFVLNNSPSLKGLTVMDISKNGSVLTNDQIQVSAPLAYGGNLTVIKQGPTALTNGDSFKLFNAFSYAGAFSLVSLPLLAPGLMWTNQLLVNGTIAVVPQTVPKISSVSRSGTNLVMTVTGSYPSANYNLYSTTNVALPLGSWQLIQSGAFDWLGNVTVTNGINFAETQRYFRFLAITGN